MIQFGDPSKTRDKLPNVGKHRVDGEPPWIIQRSRWRCLRTKPGCGTWTPPTRYERPDALEYVRRTTLVSLGTPRRKDNATRSLMMKEFEIDHMIDVYRKTYLHAKKKLIQLMNNYSSQWKQWKWKNLMNDFQRNVLQNCSRNQQYFSLDQTNMIWIILHEHYK